MLEAEAQAWNHDAEPSYEFALIGAGPGEIDLRPMVRQIVEGIERGEDWRRIAARFHTTLVQLIAVVCRRMREHLGLVQVCLSGGCFQNARLLEGCVTTLRADGFEVFTQAQVPANDGGISLGQAAVACERLRLGL